MVQVPNDASWVATGNNVVLSSEMARRVIPIRLDAKVEHPEERTGFRHPLPSWAIENRNDLVSACLSVVRSWIRAGMPEGAVTLGRFEEWASVMSGILDVAGQPDFLSNRASLRKGADSEHHDWSVLCSFWWDRFAGHPVTASDLFQVAREHGLLLGLWGGRTLLASQQRVGHSLQAHRDRVYGPYIIRTAGQDASTKSNAYRLECHAGEEPDPRNPRDSAWTNGLEPEVSGVSGVSLTPSPGEERVEVDL
jgi:hypothetical protein